MWLLNLCREPEQERLYGTYASDVTSSLFQITNILANTDTFTTSKIEIRNARGPFICRYHMFHMNNDKHNTADIDYMIYLKTVIKEVNLCNPVIP